MRAPSLLLLLTLLACADSPPPEGAGPAPTTEAPAPPAPDTLALTADDAQVAARPTALVRVDGACPFEGCVYGIWTTSAETTVYARGGDASSETFTVPAGTALDADRGYVLLTTLGTTVVERPTELYLAGGGTRPLVVGDTLIVLDDVGEGSHRVWVDGQVGFSEAGGDVGPPGEGPALRRIAEAESQWWAHVTAPDGRSGWLWMEETPSVEGADALGG